MTQTPKIGKPDRASLHARAIEEMLLLLREREIQRPTLEEISVGLDVSANELRQVFPNLQAVMDAAAEEALLRLFDTAVRAMVAVDSEDYIGQFTALGEAFIDWGLMHPAHFRLTMNRELVSMQQSETLRRYQNALRDLVHQLLRRARDQGRIAPDTDIDQIALNARAMLYGLTRMVLDDHMSEWHPQDEPVAAIKQGFRAYIDQVATQVQQRDASFQMHWAPPA